MSKERRNDRAIEYVVKEKIGVLATYSNGWTKELNVVEWNGKGDKYDIRDWDEKHERMSRGITLREEELEELFNVLSGRGFRVSQPESPESDGIFCAADSVLVEEFLDVEESELS